MASIIGGKCGKAVGWTGFLLAACWAVASAAGGPAASVSGGSVTLAGTAEFSVPDLTWGREANYSTLGIPGFIPEGAPGYPELPERCYYYLIPPGYHVVEFRVEHVDRVEQAEARRLMPVRLADWEEKGLWENPSVYASQEEYPGRAVTYVGTGKWRGERIAQVLYRPVGYRPSDGRVYVYPRVEYTLVLAPGEEGEAPVAPLRSSAEARKEWQVRLAAQVENPPVAADSDPAPEGMATGGSFRPTDYPSLDGSLVEYVIITTDDFATSFQVLADWKTQKGVPAVVRTTSWIDAHYPTGADQAERIRLFIRDAYEKWGTTYVLLGGDTDRIPTRYAYIYYYFIPQGETIPTDLYYAALDGGWDGDGDGIFGEGYSPLIGAPGDSVDLYPEVYVGRAPANTVGEVQTFVLKTKNYRLTPIAANQNKACFISEVLFPYGWNPGDPVWLNGCDIAADAISWMVPGWDTVKICEWPDQDMSLSSVKSALNAGDGLVSIITHGDAFKVSTSDGQYIRIDDMLGLTNNNKFSVYYYSNCNTSQFDAECFNEATLFNPTGGGVGIIGPARLEFPHVSRAYLEEFYRLVFRTQIDALGELSEAHRAKWAGSVYSDGANRWVHLAQVLLGDPELRVWKSLPDSMVLAHAGSMGLSDTTYTVTVTHLGAPVQRVLTTLWGSATGDYARGLTDAAGQITFRIRPTAAQTLTLSATHRLYKTRTSTVTVGGAAARIELAGVVIDDDAGGLSSGNGDGVADAGERIELGVKLKNTGGVAVSNVGAGLGLAAGSHVTLDVRENGFSRPGRVFVGSRGEQPVGLPTTFQLSGDSLSPWARPLFTTSAIADTGAYFWQDLAGWHLRLVGGQSRQTFSGYLRTDGQMRTALLYGGESGDLLGGDADSVGFSVSLDSSDVEDGVDVVIADSSGVSVFIDTAAYGTLAPGDTATQFFLVENAMEAPDQHQARFDVTVTGDTPTSASWREGLRLEVEAPFPGDEFHAVDDTTDGGNGDGRIQVGETVRLLPRVRNQGHGAAIGVQGTLRPAFGVTILDSTETFGDIAAGALVAGGGNGFKLTSTALFMSVQLELRDAYGRSWTQAIELGVPTAPTVVKEDPVIPLTQRAVDLTWTPPVASDVRGYNIYRSTTSGSGYARVNGGSFDRSAFFHDLTVNNETTYFYRVAAVDSAGNQSALSAEKSIMTRPAWQGTFPKTTKGTIWSSPMVMDLGEDASGDLEVIVGSEDGYLYVYNPDGTLRLGWPKQLGGEVWSSPAVGNLDADAAMEIVVGCNANKVFAFNNNGSGLINPDGTFATVSQQIRAAPVLADLDRDGSLEVIAGTLDGKLYAWRKDGTAYGASSIFATVSGGVAAAATVADLDGNGDLEVMVPTLNGKIYAWNHDKTGFRDTTGVFTSVTGGIWSNVAVGDVNGDSFMDVIGATFSGKIYRWSYTAIVQPGWPVQTGGEIWASPALGDLNGDGKLDIVVGSSDANVYALKFDGSNLPGWPVAAADSVWSSAALADITGDGIPEVICGSMDKHVHAWKRDGTEVPGWPLLLPERVYGSGPAVADLDRDGDVEVVIGAYDGRVWCWDIHQPWNPSRSASPWPMYGHDTYRTNWYNQPLTEVAEGAGGAEVERVTYGVAQNAPNPFNPRTSIRYGLAAEGPASLVVYDVTGRRVRTLLSGPQPAGAHEVVWDGRADGGQEAASGVYFYRLEAGGQTFSRKMILAR